MTRLTSRSSRPVCGISSTLLTDTSTTPRSHARDSTADNAPDKKAREEMAKKAGGKGPMNTGQQGIKKSGKKK